MLAEDHVVTQANVEQGTQDMLERKRVSSKGTLTREYINTQGMMTCEHVST